MTAPIRSMPELLDALRARRDALNISHETLDSISGLQSGYTSKLLAPKPIKNLGPITMGPLLGALGLAIVVVEDQAAVAAVKSRWVKRKRPQKLEASALMLKPPETQETSEQLAKRQQLKMWGSMGGKVSAKRRMKVMKKRTRQRIAAHAARKRWEKRRA